MISRHSPTVAMDERPLNAVPWFDEHVDRFTEETGVLERNGFALDREELKKGTVQFRGQAKYDGRALLVRFPEGFPSFAPRISDTPDAPLLHRHHTPYTRDFCLFGPGAVRWSADKSADSAVDEVEDLLIRYSGGSSEDSDTAPEPLSAALPYEAECVVLVPAGIAEKVQGAKAFSHADRFTLILEENDSRLSHPQPLRRGIVTRIKLANITTTSRPYPLRKASEIEGYIFTLSESPNSGRISEILATCRKQINPQNRQKEFWIALVFPEQSKEQKSHRLTWVLARLKKDGTFSFVRTFQESTDSRISRINGYAPLSARKVGIIGCGCLGSKIAAALAATGVENFVLVDCDVMDPANSVRHECGTDLFGIPKSHALAVRLATLNPRIFQTKQILPSPIRLGAAFDPKGHAKTVSALLSCDLIVESGGAHSLSRFVNNLAYKNNIPSIYASVSDGAWSGEIVAVQPGKTACWLCWCHEYYWQKPPAAPGSQQAVFHPGCDQPSFTGTTFETGIVAQMAAWKCADMLLIGESGRKPIDQPYLVWTGRDAEGTPALRWDRLPTTRREGCALCGKRGLIEG